MERQGDVTVPRCPRALLAAARRLCARRSVVIGGHGVGNVELEHDPHHLCVPVDRFRAQVELLLEAGFRFTTVAGLVALASEGVAPPPGNVALTFDDGMDNNVSVVLPLLREYAIPATVYVISGLVGQPNPWMAAASGARMMTADELRELQAAGVELGAHTVTHPDLAGLDREACLREAAESRVAVAEIAGRPVTTFAYPFNRSSPAAIAAARDAGFAAAVAGPHRDPWSPWEIPRPMITGIDGLAAFTVKAAGMYDPLWDSRAGRVARAVTRRPRRLLRRSAHD